MPLDSTEIPVNANLSDQDRARLNKLNREREQESVRILIGQALAEADERIEDL